MVLLQVDIAEKLVKTAKVEQQCIVILSPYNAQVSEIKDKLKEKTMDRITVTTITKSQGDCKLYDKCLSHNAHSFQESALCQHSTCNFSHWCCG